MIIVGICGSSGSGKSTVGLIFQGFGAAFFDCDKIYHDLVSAPSECLNAIGERFGYDLIQNGSLDRKKLSDIVFSDPLALSELNQITHRFVLDALRELIDAERKKDAPMCVIDAPLFFEAGLEKWCDFVIAVISDEKQQLHRIHRRDGISEDLARLRIQSQIGNDELIARSQFVIENTGSILDLELQCNNIYQTLRKADML